MDFCLNSFYIISPGHWANIIPVIIPIIFSQLPGEYTSDYVQAFFGAPGLIKHINYLNPHMYYLHVYS